MHALWELSCRTENHAQICGGLMSQLAGAVRSEEPHVAAVAAATAWLLSECDDTRARLPMAELVPALPALTLSLTLTLTLTLTPTLNLTLTLGGAKCRYAPV